MLSNHVFAQESPKRRCTFRESLLLKKRQSEVRLELQPTRVGSNFTSWHHCFCMSYTSPDCNLHRDHRFRSIDPDDNSDVDTRESLSARHDRRREIVPAGIAFSGLAVSRSSTRGSCGFRPVGRLRNVNGLLFIGASSLGCSTRFKGQSKCARRTDPNCEHSELDRFC